MLQIHEQEGQISVTVRCKAAGKKSNMRACVDSAYQKRPRPPINKSCSACRVPVTGLDIAAWGHYYRNANLSRLGNPCCPGFPTGNARPGQKGGSFCPRSGNRDKRCCQRHVAGAPFCPGWWTKGLFFFFSQFFFYFNYTFAFQLNLCIRIQCV